MVTMGKYEAKGTGLNDARTRKGIYTAAIVFSAVVLAVIVTMGLISIDQVNSFITLVVTLVGILAGVLGLVTAALARNNVEPPADPVQDAVTNLGQPE